MMLVHSHHAVQRVGWLRLLPRGGFIPARRYGLWVGSCDKPQHAIQHLHRAQSQVADRTSGSEHCCSKKADWIGPVLNLLRSSAGADGKRGGAYLDRDSNACVAHNLCHFVNAICQIQQELDVFVGGS